MENTRKDPGINQVAVSYCSSSRLASALVSASKYESATLNLLWLEGISTICSNCRARCVGGASAATSCAAGSSADSESGEPSSDTNAEGAHLQPLEQVLHHAGRGPGQGYEARASGRRCPASNA